MKYLPKLKGIKVHVNGIFEKEGYNNEEYKTLAAFRKSIKSDTFPFLDTVHLTYGIGRKFVVTYEIKQLKDDNWSLTGGGKNKEFYCDNKKEFIEIIEKELEQIY